MPHYLAAEVVRGEPDYSEQVPRLASWLHDRPGWSVAYFGSFWEAILREEDGVTVITRDSLAQLLDKLELLDGLKSLPG